MQAAAPTNSTQQTQALPDDLLRDLQRLERCEGDAAKERDVKTYELPNDPLQDHHQLEGDAASSPPVAWLRDWKSVERVNKGINGSNAASKARSIFDRKLQALPNELSHEDLLHLYGAEGNGDTDSMAVVKSLQNCKFFDRFNTDIHEFNAQQEKRKQQFIEEHGESAWWDIQFSGQHHDLKSRRSLDYRLSDVESAQLRSNGVIVLSRLAHDSFGDAYYRIYNNDLPVFITADSILHAWHRSFDDILIETEMEHLAAMLLNVLQCALETVRKTSSSTTIDQAVLEDLEVFLAVPMQLLTRADTDGSNARVNRQVSELINHVEKGCLQNVSIFSSYRDVDFSQFTPRGHYTKSPALTRYFRAMMWLGTIDIRLWTKQSPEEPEAHLHALQRAVALTWILRKAKQLHNVNHMMQLITSLVGGGSDSMTPEQLAELLPDEDGDVLVLLGDFSQSKQALEALFTTINNRNLGAQQIAGHPHFTEDLQSNGGLPLSFAMFGQQFSLSSFVLSNVVFDNVKYKGEPVDRRVPSVSLDVGFALFGNDTAVPELARRMGRDTSQATCVERLRDGLPYASNLVALRRTVDTIYGESPKLEQSIGDQWVGMLRQLSAKCPVASPTFHSKAWRLRQLTTQVASFAQLRHDTLLYAKQSNTMRLLCEYPAGYVEPYPDFWRAFQRMVGSLVALIPLHNVKAFLVRFGVTLETLREISECQRDGKQLTSKQKEFLRDVIEVQWGSGDPSYGGWYPGLFYNSSKQVTNADYLVADVHTDLPSLTSPGHVVHLGVGQVFSGVFVVDDVMYTGPVFSSYEVVTPFPTRLTDEEFGKKMQDYSCEPWATASYVV